MGYWLSEVSGTYPEKINPVKPPAPRDSLLLILEISATYRLVSYTLADNWLICRLRAQCMIYNLAISIQVLCDGVFAVIFFKTMYNKTIIRWVFCDILNNQGLGKCYQPRSSGRLITLTETLIISDITKTSSNNCLEYIFAISGGAGRAEQKGRDNRW